MQTPLSVIDLDKSYGNIPATIGISFNVDAGEILGLLGVNGAGKSTLIKCILDLIEIDSGEITIFGTRHREIDSRTNLAYLSEQFRPPKFTTGVDVLRLLCGIENLNYPEEQVTKLCDALALDDKVLKAPCRSYSKGMRQKLGLIACLLAEKPLLLLDEPMSGLDPLARRLFKDCLLKHKAQGRSVFFSTHLLEDVESVCDRVMIIDGGRLRFIGQIEALLEATKQESLEAAFLAIIRSPIAA